jgi:hypothetical protein
MLRFQCDGCGKLKETNDSWIMGLSAENIGIASHRREICMASAWDRTFAADALAVHFCSDRCRAIYANERPNGVPQEGRRIPPGVACGHATAIGRKMRSRNGRHTAKAGKTA